MITFTDFTDLTEADRGRPFNRFLNYQEKNDTWIEYQTPLSECVKYGNLATAKFLLAWGADPIMMDHLAIKQAACWGQIELLQLLHSYDIDVDTYQLLLLSLEEIDHKMNYHLVPVDIPANEFYLTARYLSRPHQMSYCIH